MVAPDLRQLAYEGAPSKKMYGFDIEPAFFDLSYELYRDKEHFEATFLTADARSDLADTPLQSLMGKVDIIWCPKLLHLWDRLTQIKTAASLVALLNPRADSIFAGSQNGHPTPQDVPIAARTHGTPTLWMGNAETLKEDWAEVATLTGTQWNVEARLLDLRTIGMHQDDGTPYKKKTGYNLQWTATMIR